MGSGVWHTGESVCVIVLMHASHHMKSCKWWTGIWPESEVFRDEGLGPVPSWWQGAYESVELFDARKTCNRKLIGARYFIEGLHAEYEKPFNISEYQDYLSPRDSIGHGTHICNCRWLLQGQCELQRARFWNSEGWCTPWLDWLCIKSAGICMKKEYVLVLTCWKPLTKPYMMG